ncbi:MAG: FAD:protein FMN transferase [Lachnospiraceae bacterium]|nr:FAD:protein FMN transferase [Lachnospiraceae bacterium]
MKIRNKNTPKTKKAFSNLIIILILMISVPLYGCGKTSNTSGDSISKSGFYFDTIIEITLNDTEDLSALDHCFEIASEYEALLSANISTSDISNINSHPGEYVKVDERTIDVLEKALYYCKLSDGAFDITIGALTELWNISQIAESCENEDNQVSESYIPSKEAIDELVQHVNYENVIISDQQVMLKDSEAKIDLGGIAKGYIADQMKQYLNENNITSGIINLGGNIITIGPKSSGDDYHIGIQYPFKDASEVITSVSFSDGSIVTSGIYERYFKVDDVIYHHILDPDSGYPVNTDLYSVSIISTDSCDCDALSTIALSYGLDKGMELIESLDGVEAIFITNQYEIFRTSGL